MASPNVPPKLISFSESTISGPTSHQIVKKTRNLYLAVIISSFCVFCFGTTVGWTNPAETLVLRKNAHKFKPTKAQWDWICLMLPLGVAIWCLPMGALMKYHGCKSLMFLQVVPYTGGWILFICANNIYMLYVGRFLQGMCGAAVCLAVPVYLDEISQLPYRGFIGCFYFGAFIYGIIYSNLMIEYIRLQTVYAINIGLALFFILLKLIPESPMRHIYNNKMDKARDTLTWLRVKDHDVNRELTALSRVIDSEMGPSLGCCTELKRSRSLRAVSRSSVLMMLHQAGGGAVIISYLYHIFNDITDGHYMTCRLWVCFSMCVGHLICVLLVERAGRRPLLLISTIIMSICSLYLCCWFKFSASSGWQMPTRMILYIFVGAYAMGQGPIGCLLNVELIVAAARPCGCAIGNLVSWLTVFIMVTWLSYRIQHHVLFYLLLVICLVVLLFVIVFLPETKGLSPLQIQRRLNPTWEDHFSDES